MLKGYTWLALTLLVLTPALTYFLLLPQLNITFLCDSQKYKNVNVSFVDWFSYFVVLFK